MMMLSQTLAALRGQRDVCAFFIDRDIYCLIRLPGVVAAALWRGLFDHSIFRYGTLTLFFEWYSRLQINPETPMASTV